ncbi:hypothetical protein NDU88_007398 [Pleurodeles waltl]|uniref:Uncharacterized protein n=1 Tax=Pleurodeles waltl TaxID=8319 RepID=A0AAV7UNP5_PLEWA|nr:hypothetical protein NDU88_007398 [Pleurodeles waltl]
MDDCLLDSLYKGLGYRSICFPSPRVEPASDLAVRRREASRKGTHWVPACGRRLLGMCIVGDAARFVAASVERPAQEAFFLWKESFLGAGGRGASRAQKTHCI